MTFECRRLSLAASIGVAVFPDDGDQPDALVEAADQAMYAIKRQRSRTRESAAQGSAAGG
jgi:GGDEF domain-containing protein